MNGLFITGTDTGVGKTMVTSLLLALARECGINATVMKPVQTGWPEDDDLSACGVEATPLHAPYRFKRPASPHLAGKVAATKILSAYRELAKQYEYLLVEGAGGILVPLNTRHTMLDLMKAMKLPSLVVARAGLGTLNHTLLTLNELRRAKIQVAGIVLNPGRCGKWDAIERDNLKTLRARAGCPVVRIFSNDWKTRRKNFQSLELFLPRFPIIGTRAEKSAAAAIPSRRARR